MSNENEQLCSARRVRERERERGQRAGARRASEGGQLEATVCGTHGEALVNLVHLVFFEREEAGALLAR